VGIHEMKAYLVREDLDQWLPLIQWLEAREGVPEAIGTSPSEGAAVVPALAAAVAVSDHSHAPGQLNGAAKLAIAGGASVMAGGGSAMAAEPTIEYTVTSGDLASATTPEAAEAPAESPPVERVLAEVASEEGAAAEGALAEEASAEEASAEEASENAEAAEADLEDPLVDTIVASEGGR